MKYFYLTHNGLNLKETGTQFQSVTGIPGDIQQDFIPREGKINFPFNLPEPFLEKKAKPTTYLNVVMIPDWFLVFKMYFIDFLLDYKLGEFQIWNIIVHHHTTIEDYAMFYLTKTSESEIIDFKRSVFEINDHWIIRKSCGQIIKFPDYDSYRSELKKHTTSPFLLANQLILDFSKQENDLIRLAHMPMTGTGFYVSENLKNAIQKRQFTGFGFQEIEDVDKRIKAIY